MYRSRQSFYFAIGSTPLGQFMSREDRRNLANQQYAAQFHPSVQNLVLAQYK